MRKLCFLSSVFSILFQGTKVSSQSEVPLPCTEPEGEILKHEGCLIQTCENHFVRESLSEECIQLIEKIVEGKLEKKLCKKDDDDITVTELADFAQDDKEEESSGDYEDEDNTDTMISDDRDLLYLGEIGAYKLPSFTPASNCSIPNHRIKRLRFAVTELVNGKIMTCGGYDTNGKDLDSCYVLNGTRWQYKTSMRYERVSAAASMTKDGWLVTGGTPERARTTTEIYSELFENFWHWKMGPTMPWGLSGHCQVTSSAGVIVAGSDWIKKPDGNEGSFVVGILEGNTWRKLADLDSGFRFWHSCELINDEKLVIMGGKNKNGKRVDILDLKSNTWSKGPEIPGWHYMRKGHSIIYRDMIYIIDNPDDRTVFSIPVTMQGEWKEVTKLDTGYKKLPIREVYPAPLVSPNLLGC